MTTTIKTCFKCGAEKPLADFYKHPQMKDGRVNKCKDCNKRDVSANYEKNKEAYQSYELDRNKRPGRKADKLRYQKIRRANHPLKHSASSKVSNAVRSGALTRMPCEVCGTDKKVEGHHDDYTKPLLVRWLCLQHHREWHRNNEAKT